MVWPVGELQLFYKVTRSCLLSKEEKGKGSEREGERKKLGREKRDLSTSYI